MNIEEERKDMEKKKVLLYSGGVDSWLIGKLWKPDVKVYIDIDGKYSREELEHLKKQHVEVVQLPGLSQFEQDNAYLPFRNMYFLGIAASLGDVICLGAVHGDEGGRDKTSAFFKMTEELLNYCSHGSTISQDHDIKVETKFMQFTKYELLQQYLEAGGSLEKFVEETFSCYQPEDGHECWNCKPCYRKFLLAKYFGFDFSTDIEQKMLNYMKEEVIPLKKTLSGTYFTKRPGEGAYAQAAVDKFFKQHGLNWRDYQ